jgi:hypothetical protein
MQLPENPPLRSVPIGLGIYTENLIRINGTVRLGLPACVFRHILHRVEGLYHRRRNEVNEDEINRRVVRDSGWRRRNVGWHSEVGERCV